MTTKNMPEKWPGVKLETSANIDFHTLSLRVFDAEKMTIGGMPITPQMKDLYKEQARYLLTSNIWEVIEATVISEAGNLALKSSADWQHVQFAKALDYWHTIVAKMLRQLST